MITFNLSSTDFQINTISVKFPVEIETLREIFIISDRQTYGTSNTLYTWDDLGIIAYSKDGNRVETLGLSLQLEEFDFYPKQIFKGTFYFDGEEVVSYYNANKEKRVPLFHGSKSYFLFLNNIKVSFHLNDGEVKHLEIVGYDEIKEKENEIPKDKYIIKKLDEEEITFADFGFKLSVIQELMYNQKLIQPEFDLYEFAEWYPHRKIDIEKEGYDQIEEVTQYFKDLPIPKRFAPEITNLWQDGGDDIYMNLLRFGNGCETCWDIECSDDAKNFPNLKTFTLCYVKFHVIDELEALGIETD